ncbi:MAG: hypothetical protein D3903_07350 [Candidatus Electrothrix sp. GM3_4]|nr:hypothetical protein [Candidatus Electrothrix sp. GM3_4]
MTGANKERNSADYPAEVRSEEQKKGGNFQCRVHKKQRRRAGGADSVKRGKRRRERNNARFVWEVARYRYASTSGKNNRTKKGPP